MGYSKQKAIDEYAALVERDGNICQGIAHYAKFYPEFAKRCKRVPAPGERFDKDHVDGNRKHNCLANKQILCHPCNELKKYLQNKAKMFGQVFDNHKTSTCMCVFASTSASVSATAVACASASINSSACAPGSSTADSNHGIPVAEKEESKHTRTRMMVVSEFAWPRYRYWSLLVYHLGYEINHDVLKDTITAEMGLRRGTVVNNYYQTITAKFSGLFHENIVDRLASFERNPDVEVDEVEADLLTLIQQWEDAGRDEVEFSKVVDRSIIRSLARLFKMDDAELLKKLVVRLERAPKYIGQPKGA